MRADRLLRLLMLLQRHRRQTAAWLADELEVSKRTVLRDMEALSAAGVPVYTERGRHGGCVLLDDFTTCLLYTSDAADEEDSVDLGGRRIIKKKNKQQK